MDISETKTMVDYSHERMDPHRAALERLAVAARILGFDSEQVTLGDEPGHLALRMKATIEPDYEAKRAATTPQESTATIMAIATLAGCRTRGVDRDIVAGAVQGVKAVNAQTLLPVTALEPPDVARDRLRLVTVLLGFEPRQLDINIELNRKRPSVLLADLRSALIARYTMTDRSVRIVAGAHGMLTVLAAAGVQYGGPFLTQRSELAGVLSPLVTTHRVILY